MTYRERVIDLNPPLSPEEAAAREAAAMATEDTVRHVAGLVRWIYMSLARSYKGDMTYGEQRIPAWDGGKDKWGTERTEIWPRLARHLLELNADPLLYMRAQFTYMSRARVPVPTTFFNDEAVAKYHRYCTEWPQSLRSQYDLALLSVQGILGPYVTRMGWAYPRALRSVLSNMVQVIASPLFRYCMAANEGLPDVAAAFHDEALGEYVFQKAAYDEQWGDRIPAELRRDAEEIRATMLSYRKGS